MTPRPDTRRDAPLGGLLVVVTGAPHHEGVQHLLVDLALQLVSERGGGFLGRVVRAVRPERRTCENAQVRKSSHHHHRRQPVLLPARSPPVTHAAWPGPARPPPRPPAPPTPPPGTWLAVARELLGLLATLAVLAGMLLLIEHVGSTAP